MTKSSYNKIKREYFFIIDNDYVKLYAKYLGVTATAVFNSLNMHADSEGKCFPSMELIAEQHNINRHTVSKALKKLEEWNMINIAREYNRKLKKRKNNVYKLIPKERWKKLPVKKSDNKSHGTKNAMTMASKIPYDVTEDASNKTHITRNIEEKSIWGKPPNRFLSPSGNLKLSKNWNSDKAILALRENTCKDYQIIGLYFHIQQWYFPNESTFDIKLKRSLRAAKTLIDYPISDIKMTMVWLNGAGFDYNIDENWSLEAVGKYINDCIATDFIPDGEERTEKLNIINT